MLLRRMTVLKRGGVHILASLEITYPHFSGLALAIKLLSACQRILIKRPHY